VTFLIQICNVIHSNVEIQNERAAMLGVTGATMYSMLGSADHHLLNPITHN